MKNTHITVAAALAAALAMLAGASSDGKGDKVKETALFKVDGSTHTILGLAGGVKGYLDLKLVSVTTDQPVYWPHETVFLKALMPAHPSAKVVVSVRKKDATPQDLGARTLNEAGILVEKVLSGKDTKLEAGEYRVEVKSKDGALSGSATFSVVEGALGAVSFAHDFEEVTDPAKLEKAKGAWFMGNAAGVGMRWGNGLNVKNEVRALNQPYTGKVTVKSRCFLPGCDGVAAGPQKELDLADGLLEVFLDVGGHSGPFEIEVITDKGSVRHLFAHSGHVERQSVTVSRHLTAAFSATLAPYEGTTEVAGRQVYVAREKETTKDPVELVSPVCDGEGKIELTATKDIAFPKLFVLAPGGKEGSGATQVKLDPSLKEGTSVKVECPAPYGLVAMGGFLGTKKDFWEGWAIVFRPSRLDAEVAAPGRGMPKGAITVSVKTVERGSGKGVPAWGILEVFDNRVPSGSALDPVHSAVGDSFRGVSSYLSTWKDWTGIDEMMKEEAPAPKAKAYKKAGGMASIKMPAPSMAASGAMGFMASSPPSGPALADGQGGAEAQPAITETIREGEEKVVFCDAVKTDAKGAAEVNVTLPPQAGRVTVRFVAVQGYEYAERAGSVDVKKGTYVELHAPRLVTPGSKVTATALVVNEGKEQAKLTLSGGGLPKELAFEVAPGAKEIAFELKGGSGGTLTARLAGASGKTLDTRTIEVADVSKMPVTFSDVVVSDGGKIVVGKGRKAAVYANPGRLLSGIVSNVVTTTYSWFGHAEALSASAAVRAMLLRAIEDKILDDEGLRAVLVSDLAKTVKDLGEVFYDKDARLFRPYPGLPVSELWSAWTARNLAEAAAALKGSPALAKELAGTISLADGMAAGAAAELKKKKAGLREKAFWDADAGKDVVPVVVDGKEVLKVVTDDAVQKWYNQKVLPKLDLPNVRTIRELIDRWQKVTDVQRFLEAFERTGGLFHLLLGAKSLLAKKDKNFFPLFNAVARGMIHTQDPGMIQGPALMGGVYSSPQTLVKFLDLLVTMAKSGDLSAAAAVELKKGIGKKEKKTVGASPLLVDAKEGEVTVTAPAYAVVRIDDTKTVDLYDYLENKAGFDVKIDQAALPVGGEAWMTVQLDAQKDPSEYYAVVAAPSTCAIVQTGDLLSDYKGKLIYGQKAGGGETLQLVAVPFRGSRTMTLRLEGAFKGESEGYVMVRHLTNPDSMTTLKTPKMTVK